MAPTTTPARSFHLHGLINVAKITVVFIFFISILPSKSGGISVMLERREIGSRPPDCVNKCVKCRPCMATLVVPNHQKIKGLIKVASHEDDDTYYLLTWKCRCGNKMFQP